MKKISVGILGATGSVGKRFVQLLDGHPWFSVTHLAASARSAGKTYEKAMEGKWDLSVTIPKTVNNLRVLRVREDCDLIASNVDFVFSALDMEKGEIQKIEEKYASLGIPVISNNSAHRWTEDVPIIMPEINSDHTKLINIQRGNRGWKHGFIVVKPNCSIQSYVSILTALKKYVPLKVHVVSMQAISGAGKTFETWPDMLDNVIPYIEGEEEKSEQEPLKIWGRVKNNKIVLASTPVISATCVRVPVSEGHIASVAVTFKTKPSKEEILRAIELFQPLKEYDLPTAPKQFIHYFEENDHPQIRVDRMREDGMGISMGRLQEDAVFDWKFISLAHNTIRGAAGGAILLAELLKKQGYL